MATIPPGKQDENRVYSKGIVTRNDGLVYSRKNKPMLTIQVRLRRTPDMPLKIGRDGRPEADFPFYSIQGTVAEWLKDMPVGTPVSITGALTTRWHGPDGHQHMTTEVYVLWVSIILYEMGITVEPSDTPDLQQPPAPPIVRWVPEFPSDPEPPLAVGSTTDKGGVIVASYRAGDGSKMLNTVGEEQEEQMDQQGLDALAKIKAPVNRHLREAFERKRASKHKNNRANRALRRANALADQLKSTANAQQPTPSSNEADKGGEGE
jgi:hypothetical protein